jgi:hypothetical protein
VERHVTGGVPPHRQPSARDRKLQKGQSSIFVVEWSDFNEMDAKEIQDIYRHRHILVVNWPEKTLKFDREGLSWLGPMKKAVDFQGEWLASLGYLHTLTICPSGRTERAQDTGSPSSRNVERSPRSSNSPRQAKIP